MRQVSDPQQDVDVDMGALFGALWVQRLRIGLAVLLCTALAVLAVILLPKSYRGEARVIVEVGESVFTRAGNPEASTLDPEAVESQVALMTSTEVLKNLADRLNLAERDEFKPSSLPFLGGKGDLLERVRQHIRVYRVENSRVLVIEFTSGDPQLAADGANALAEEYVAAQAKAKADNNASAAAWLSPEIEALQERVRDAEAAIAAYRAENDIPSVRTDGTLAGQQLSDLSTELSRVRAAAADAAAKARSVSEALGRGEGAASLPSALNSPIVQNLQDRRAAVAGQIAELSSRLLDNHPRMRGLRRQLAQLDQQILSEARKAANALSADAETARIREQELSDRIAALKAESARVDEDEVGLRALQREASAQRDLLESYLARYRAAQSRKATDYQPVNARIFSRATVPTSPVFPKPVPIVAAAFAGSLLLAIVAVLLSELMSGRALRPTGAAVASDVERDDPDVDQRPAERVKVPRRTRPTPPAIAPAAADLSALAGEPSVAVATTAAEAVAVLARTGASRVVFVSPEGDGAAIVGIAIARAIADAGIRAVLVDLTEGSAASAPLLEGERATGIMDVLADKMTLSQVIHGDRYSELMVVPFGLADPAAAIRQIDRLPDILDGLDSVFDMVLIEAGPADAEGVGKLRSDDAEIMVSVIDAADDARPAARPATARGRLPQIHDRHMLGDHRRPRAAGRRGLTGLTCPGAFA